MSESPYQLAVILGSVRSGRFGPVAANWFIRQAQKRGDVVVDLIDLAETPLPVTGQVTPVVTGVYESADVRAYAERIGRADAFVIVTPEYNHGYPGALKVAIDAVNPEWHAKPVAFVSYGGISGGLRAVEQLRQIFGELHTVTIRETVSFAMCHGKFDEDGEPLESGPVNQAAKVLLDQIGWWARALRDARAARPYGA